MICAFCGHEFNEHDGKKGCGGCAGGCHSVHCPRCNYKNPLEPDVIKLIRNLFSKKDGHKGDTQSTTRGH